MNDVLSKDQWISFYIDGAAYAQPINVLREIVPYREATPVPGAPSEVEGIVNIRGDVLSVICGRRLMNANPVEHDENSRILIIEHENSLMGFSVDCVKEIIGFNNDQIDTNQGDNHLIRGTVNLEDDLYIVTDLGLYHYEQDDYE